jgi:hypothetical protein
MYTRFVDVWDAIDRAAAVLAGDEFARAEYLTRKWVT